MEDGILTWDIDPVIVWITDSFPLKYYGLLFMSGILLGYFIINRIYKRENVPTEDLDKLLTYIIFGTLIGARLGHCLFYEPDYYLEHPVEMILPIRNMGDGYQFIGYQGLASHGGVVGVFLAILYYCKKFKTPFLWVLDRIAIVGPMAGAFIRFGNFMNSEIYGKPTNGNWGVVFARDDMIPRHPTQLYEAFSYLLISFILYRIYLSRGIVKKDGFVFGVFLVLLFLARFVIEFFKENQVGFEEGMALNMGQILSIPFVVAGVVMVALKSSSGGSSYSK
ncbi:prolipoprotein diacylglyceryl transferase [Membranihabitans maritimus]|uniref:prolipoprotein diacylglyceryl transferase n=1 Tax=Membranihabitans maritimus TaxID=2904244 RepID=UPI001EFF8220|nr:prolipoprotein diacylglyceryl transferase [Membranihabitans maritimus]